MHTWDNIASQPCTSILLHVTCFDESADVIYCICARCAIRDWVTSVSAVQLPAALDDLAVAERGGGGLADQEGVILISQQNQKRKHLARKSACMLQLVQNTKVSKVQQLAQWQIYILGF